MESRSTRWLFGGLCSLRIIAKTHVSLQSLGRWNAHYAIFYVMESRPTRLLFGGLCSLRIIAKTNVSLQSLGRWNAHYAITFVMESRSTRLLFGGLCSLRVIAKTHVSWQGLFTRLLLHAIAEIDCMSTSSSLHQRHYCLANHPSNHNL